MLIRFRVSNFRSLRDEQELSMVAAFRAGRKDLVHAEALGLDLLRVVGIYGANAAGKSNLWAAIGFVRTAVTASHRGWEPDGPIPYQPFLFEPTSRISPSLFEMDFLLEGIHFQYGFELNAEKILSEWLYAFPNKRRQVWFTRDASSSKPFQFGKHLKGNNRLIEKLTRHNSLFLSAAAENAHDILSPIYSWFSRRLLIGGVATREPWVRFTAGILEKRHEEVLDLLRLADLGIVDVRLSESTDQPGGDVEFEHQSKDDPVYLPFNRQSRGTQAWFSITGPVLEALENGSLLCLDEIDASLHPLLTLEIIRIFESPKRNPRNAQLIFNSHDTALLGSLLETPVLQRDQIWFVEKDEEGASHLYPLTDFKPRKFENVERGYLQGRYGAVPYTDPSEAA